MWVSNFVRLFLVGGVLLGSPSLFAARVAVLPPKIEADPPLSEGRRNKMHDTLAQGLREAASDWTVLSAEETRRLLQNTDLSACESPACMGQVAKKLQTDHVVAATIAVKSAATGSTYVYRLRAFEASGQGREVPHTGRCGDDGDGCNWAGALDSLRKTAALLVPLLKTAPVLTAGNKPPVENPPPVVSAEVPLVATPTQNSAVSAPVPAVLDTTPPVRHTGYRIGWIASGIVAGGLLVTSIPFLVLSPRDGQITCTDGRPSKDCPTRYQGNLATGLGLLGGGLAAATVFGVLFYLDRKDLKRSQGRVAVLPLLQPSGGGLVFVQRF